MIKALSFMLIMAVEFVFSYLFVDFSLEGKTDLQKGMSILPCFLGLIGYGLDILWLSQRFTRWAFVCSIVCKYAFFAMWGLMFAGVVHDRPEVWPVVVAFFVDMVFPGSYVWGVAAGSGLAVFAVLSFFADVDAVEWFSRCEGLSGYYEWGAAFSLVFDVVLCIAGLAKATSENSSDTN